MSGMRARSSAWLLHIPGLGKEAAAQLLPRELQVRAIDVLLQIRALGHRVVDELTHFRALTIFCFSQWWPPWSTELSSTDASLYGYGLTASDSTHGDVAEAAPVKRVVEVSARRGQCSRTRSGADGFRR